MRCNLLQRAFSAFSACGRRARAEKALREQSFCAYVIGEAALREGADARLDPSFGHLPMVPGESYIRFGAGLPVTMHKHPGNCLNLKR